MLSKENRLRLKKEFKRVFDTGKWGGEQFISLKYAKNGGFGPRIGFMIGKKVSKSAVKRNFIKRKMREVVRLALKSGEIVGNFDVIVVAKPEIVGNTYAEIEKTLLSALKRVF